MEPLIQALLGAMVACGLVAIVLVNLLKRTVNAHNDRLNNHWNEICELKGRINCLELKVGIASNSPYLEEDEEEFESTEEIPPHIQEQVTQVMTEHGLIPG